VREERRSEDKADRKGGQNVDSARSFEREPVKRTVLRSWRAFFRSLL